ncbi:MAG: 16S rRNA (guanine(527)-N(7))-methyltransferase RsmG [Alphaproteobacteria bacterium]|nr:16S rRNA (guanine(527)-N(7))-methyltransferase RsmG [Alphaproteobacteria bacterium]
MPRSTAPGARLTPAGFQEATNVSRETLARLQIYADLLVKWQKAINLVGPDTIPDLWRRHFLDSAQLHPLIPPEARRVVDFGSGAGFPGLVLALMGDREIHLIESDARKIAFLREAARLTSAPVVLHHGRIEQIQPFPVDVVTARALAPITALLGYTEPYLALSEDRSCRCLFLKGRTAEQELTDAEKLWNMKAIRVPSSAGGEGVILILEGIHSADRQPC